MLPANGPQSPFLQSVALARAILSLPGLPRPNNWLTQGHTRLVPSKQSQFWDKSYSRAPHEDQAEAGSPAETTACLCASFVLSWSPHAVSPEDVPSVSHLHKSPVTGFASEELSLRRP